MPPVAVWPVPELGCMVVGLACWAGPVAARPLPTIAGGGPGTAAMRTTPRGMPCWKIDAPKVWFSAWATADDSFATVPSRRVVDPSW